MSLSHGHKHVMDYWMVLVRRRWVLYLTLTGALLLALLGSFLVQPLYRSTVTVQIERLNPSIFTHRDLAQIDNSWAAYSDFYQTQYKLIASTAVAHQAAERLGLDSHPLFQVEDAPPGLRARLRALLPSKARTLATPDRLDLAAQRLLGGLEVSPIRNSHLVRISWVGPDPKFAAQVANAMADAYIQLNIESQYSTTDQAREFLVNQMGMLKREISGIEERLQEYGESKGIISIDESNNITLEALRDIAERRTAAQTTRAQTQGVYSALRGSPPEALPEVLNSALIAKLREEYAAYEAEFSEQASTFKSGWPGMLNLQAKLEQAKLRLELETERIARQVRAAAEAEYQKALNEVDNLDRLLQEQEAAAQQLKRDAVEFANLQSEVLKKRETLDTLITRQNEMALSTRLKDLDSTSTNLRVIERAKPPAAPFRPRVKLNLLIGLLLGLGLGIAAAFSLDYLDNTISSAHQLEKIVTLPVLAVIPRHGTGRPTLSRVRRKQGAAGDEPFDLIAHADGRSPAAEAYRELRTALLLSHPGRPPRLILITSALPEEGKTATALNLSIVLAQLGRRVLIVDSDLRRPRLHRALKLSNSRGVSSYLSGQEQDSSRLVLVTAVENLHLLSSGPIPPNPSELLNSERFTQMGQSLLEQGYDHIVYDSPPVLSVSDSVILASVVEASILVVRARRTPRQSARAAADRLRQSGKGAAGVVLNDLEVELGAAYHYRYYGYARLEEDEQEPAVASRKRAAGLGA